MTHERTDLFGHAIKPTVVQPSLFERNATDAEMFAAVDRNAERLRRMTDAEDNATRCRHCNQLFTRHNPRIEELDISPTCRDCGPTAGTQDAYPEL